MTRTAFQNLSKVMQRCPVITIDGPASSGKSSLSRALSKELNCPWLSTGVFYRGIAFAGVLEGFSRPQQYLKLIQSDLWETRLSAAQTLFFYKGRNRTKELYKSSMDGASSLFSGNPLFRKALLPFQRNILKREKILIAEGRDCGTVVFPQAELKIFLKAESHVRAERRAKERGAPKTSVIQDQNIRDFRDKTRPFAPLKKPKAGLIMDTGKKDLKEAVQYILPHARKALLLS